MLKRLILASTAIIIAAPAFAQGELVWDNGGSLMRTLDDGVRVTVNYVTVRPGLRVTIPPGAVAFEGVRVGPGTIAGTAFVYTKWCPGRHFPYRVEGTANGVVDVWGPAAVVDPQSCSIVDYRPDSENAHRTFQLPAAVFVPAPIVPPSVYVPPANGNSVNNTIIVNPPVAAQDEDPDQEAARIEQQGRIFCRKHPDHRVCVKPYEK